LQELNRFITIFTKAIRKEMESMRQRLGSFEIPLGSGRANDTTTREKLSYHFAIAQHNDKLHSGLECTLRSEKSEYLVHLTQVSPHALDLECAEPIPLESSPQILVIYPWFLYEKLLDALDSLREPSAFYIDSAMRLFGKREPQIEGEGALLQHDDLNSSQLRAIDLCCRSNLAFVWGPPGTGKTSTLAPILAEMLHSGYRTLVVSTTNVAVDQALEKLLQLEAAQSDLSARRIIRIGQTGAESHGVGLREIVAENNREMLAQLKATREHRLYLLDSYAACQRLVDKMAETTEHNQLELFADAEPQRDFSREIRAIYSLSNTQRLKSLAPEALRPLVVQRQRRIGRLIALYVERIEHLERGLRQGERKTLIEAKLVFSTMSGAYLNRLLQAERFDVVVIEEAGMAVLPALFYCAALAKKKVIAVGDPRQLPPIVQSRDPFVLRAMGRNIFDITAPDPLQSKFVALLDTQYRMHPTIGHLISDLFYNGHLRHAAHSDSYDPITALAPYPGHALVLVDTTGCTHCELSGRQSRRNPNSAQLAVQLAARAAESGIDSIGIITPYVEQARLIRQQLRSGGLDHETTECSTVHRFQGRERDLIILDTTDAAPLKPGILLNGPATAANLLNVSLSRARGKLIILADTHYFHHHSPAGQISKLLHYLRTAATCKTADALLT